MKTILNKSKSLNNLNNNSKEPCIFSEKEINENLNKAVKEIEDKTATLYTKEEIDK